MYNIESRPAEPVGGAARFAAAAKRYAGERPLVLFSGDCLNPSLMSAFTRGEQMVQASWLVLRAVQSLCASSAGSLVRHNSTLVLIFERAFHSWPGAGAEQHRRALRRRRQP